MMTARERQLLNGWVAMLDVDLELAQRMLRLPPARMPAPPIALPETAGDWWRPDDVAPAMDAAAADEPPPLVGRVAPKGAYARRRAKM